MSAKIVLNNKAGFIFRNMNFDIYCDGKLIGTMNSFTTINFDAGGVYTLQAKADRWQTPVIIVKIEEGNTAHLKITTKNKHLTLIYALMLLMATIIPLASIFVKTSWFQLAEIILLGLLIIFLTYILLSRTKDILMMKDDM